MLKPKEFPFRLPRKHIAIIIVIIVIIIIIINLIKFLTKNSITMCRCKIVCNKKKLICLH